MSISPPDNPVRFIDAFVDQFDLQALGFARVIPAETGCPAYHPGDLLNASLSHVRIETAVYAQSGWPRITRAAYEDASDRMARRVRDHPEIMQLRHQLVEHPFGTFKRVMNQGYFVCRGLKKVNAEMSLSVMTYNLKRAINILGVPKLTVALREWHASAAHAFRSCLGWLSGQDRIGDRLRYATRAGHLPYRVLSSLVLV